MKERLKEDARWAKFVGKVKKLDDEFLFRIFEHAHAYCLDDECLALIVELTNTSAFFKDKIMAERGKWVPLFNAIFNPDVSVIIWQQGKRDENYFVTYLRSL